MLKHCLCAALALSAAATAQAQAWDRFLNASPAFTSTLAAPRGLAVDDYGAGGIYVQSLDAREYGPEFSHLYALNTQGGDAFPWGLVGRSGWTEATFVPRGLHAFRGYRVAWYENGLAQQPYDHILIYYPGNWYGNEQGLRLDRNPGDKVIDVAADGQGGALVVRRRGEGPAGPLPYYTLARYTAGASSPLWEQTIGPCAPGQLTLTREQIDFALDAQDPQASAVHVLGRCSDAASPGQHFLQRLELNGQAGAAFVFEVGMPGAAALASHKLGGGNWLIELSDGPDGAGRLLQIVNAQHGVQPLYNWRSGAPLRIHPVEKGVLVSAPAYPGSNDEIVGRVRRDQGWAGMPPQLINLQFYFGLGQLAGTGAQWSADLSDNRVLVYRNAAPDAGAISIVAYGLGNMPQASRRVDRVPAGAVVRLQPLPWSADIVLAVDRQHEDGRYGILVTRFPVISP
jgi:hypothetical protein